MRFPMVSQFSASLRLATPSARRITSVDVHSSSLALRTAHIYGFVKFASLSYLRHGTPANFTNPAGRYATPYLKSRTKRNERKNRNAKIFSKPTLNRNHISLGKFGRNRNTRNSKTFCLGQFKSP